MKAPQGYKHDVYEYKDSAFGAFFSAGVTREFGQNKIVTTKDRGEIFTSVMPLHSTDGLVLVGYLISEVETAK